MRLCVCVYVLHVCFAHVFVCVGVRGCVGVFVCVRVCGLGGGGVVALSMFLRDGLVLCDSFVQ
jgi:hypothetical protein